jgi:hypothetical protein
VLSVHRTMDRSPRTEHSGELHAAGHGTPPPEPLFWPPLLSLSPSHLI